MGNLNVAYTAASLNDLATGIEEMAREKREEALTLKKQWERRDMENFVDGMIFAADVVRKTIIDPRMTDDATA